MYSIGGICLIWFKHFDTRRWLWGRKRAKKKKADSISILKKKKRKSKEKHKSLLSQTRKSIKVNGLARKFLKKLLSKLKAE